MYSSIVISNDIAKEPNLAHEFALALAAIGAMSTPVGPSEEVLDWGMSVRTKVKLIHMDFLRMRSAGGQSTAGITDGRASR